MCYTRHSLRGCMWHAHSVVILLVLLLLLLYALPTVDAWSDRTRRFFGWYMYKCRCRGVPRQVPTTNGYILGYYRSEKSFVPEPVAGNPGFQTKKTCCPNTTGNPGTRSNVMRARVRFPVRSSRGMTSGGQCVLRFLCRNENCIHQSNSSAQFPNDFNHWALSDV